MRGKSNPDKVTHYKRITAIAISVLLLTSLSALVGGATANAQESEETQVILAQDLDSGQVVAASGSNRFVVWEDKTPGNYDIFFKRSSNNGATWKTSVNLSMNPGDSRGAQVVVQGSNVYVVWLQANSGGDQHDVYFRRSADNGATWGPKVNISTDGNSRPDALAVSGSFVYILFSSDESILFRRSSNNGQSFGSITTLGSAEGVPTMATSGSHVYVGWGTDDAYPLFRHSSNNGGTWESAVELPGAGYGVENFGIAATGSYVYAVWLDVVGCGGEDSIEFARSTDNGATWDGTTMAGCSEFVSSPLMAVSGSKIFVLYAEGGDIHIIRSTDNGATWNSETNLSNNPGSSRFNSIAIQGSNVYVIWTQLNAGGTLADIFLKRSTDSGATWKSSKNVSNNDGWSENGQVAVSGSNVYFTWEDDTDGDIEILFKRSTNKGATLKAVVKISNNAGDSTDARMMLIGSNIFVVWMDDTPGNNDVLHRRSTDNGATWKTTQNLSNNAGDSERPQIAG
jgi:hypothetical protein